MDWKETRMLTLKRDNYKCRRCGKEENLHVHHIISRRNHGNDMIENLITLCPSCHKNRENLFLRVGMTNHIRRWQAENKEKIG